MVRGRLLRDQAISKLHLTHPSILCERQIWLGSQSLVIRVCSCLSQRRYCILSEILILFGNLAWHIAVLTWSRAFFVTVDLLEDV